MERTTYPASIRLFRLPCVGNVNTGLILDAFELGADGVIMLACASGKCHYQIDECKTDAVFQQASELIGTLGIGEGRLRLERVADYDGENVARLLQEFTENLIVMGRNPLAS